MSLYKAINAACRDLPEGYAINIRLKKGYGGVELVAPDGEEINLDLAGLDLPDRVDEAVFAAKAAHNLDRENQKEWCAEVMAFFVRSMD